MTAPIARSSDVPKAVADSEPIETGTWPPMSDTEGAVQLRMLRDPHLFDGYDPESWVAFVGDPIVASAPNLEELHQLLEAEASTDVLILQVEPARLFGL